MKKGGDSNKKFQKGFFSEQVYKGDEKKQYAEQNRSKFWKSSTVLSPTDQLIHDALALNIIASMVPPPK